MCIYCIYYCIQSSRRLVNIIDLVEFSPKQNIVDCLDTLSFTTVKFIRSENNLALLHLFIDARTL